MADLNRRTVRPRDFFLYRSGLSGPSTVLEAVTGVWQTTDAGPFTFDGLG